MISAGWRFGTGVEDRLRIVIRAERMMDELDDSKQSDYSGLPRTL
jgi:hypothetical protein